MDSKIKKIIPYFFLLLLISVGLFAGAGRARAQSTGGTCYQANLDNSGNKIPTSLNQTQCGLNAGYSWIPTGATTPSTPITAYQNCINNGGNATGCAGLSGRASSQRPSNT